MNTTDKITGILGIGNLLLGDEGFGTYVIQYLEEHFSFPSNVQLMDGGTAGIYMAPFFEEVDRLIVVDVVALDAPAGTVHMYEGKELKGANIQMRMSPHQLGILEILEICKLRDQSPEEIHFIGVVPAEIGTGMGLSDRLAPKVAEVAAKIIEILAKQGIDARNFTGAGASQTAGSAC